MSFYSNVSPKVRKIRLDQWFCHSCNIDVARYLRQCPSCGSRREN